MAPSLHPICLPTQQLMPSDTSLHPICLPTQQLMPSDTLRLLP